MKPEDKDIFIRNYIINFLSTYAANSYADVSSGVGGKSWTTFKHPIEDAEELANQAWDEYINL